MGRFDTAVKRVGLAALFATGVARAAEVATVTSAADPHYTPAGFFDIHVCNWPGRPLFFLTLFATTRFEAIEAVEIVSPGGAVVGTLATDRYRLVEAAGKPQKRVFMAELPIPADASDGWYRARVKMRDGGVIEARDFVVIESMGRASNPNPPDGAEGIPLPAELTWQAIPGAKHYQVFIRDMWDGERVIYSSPLLAEPRAPLPPGLLLPEGLYTWRVHARDVNENVLLGDFNHGSLSEYFGFGTDAAK